MKRGLINIIIVILLLLISIYSTSAANDPGHDILYIEQQGDSELNGTLNITNNLSLTSTSKVKQGGVLTLYADGSTPGTGTYISATGEANYDLYLDTQGNVYLKNNLGGGIVYIGKTGSTPTSLNVSGALLINGSNNQLSTGAAGSASSLNLYWGDKLICNASLSNCGWVSSITGGGDITAVYTSTDTYIYNGTETGDVYLRFNESKLNNTIDARVGALGGDGNNYVTGVSVTNVTNHIITISRDGLSDITAAFTDLGSTYTAGNDIDLSGGTQIDIESTLDYVGTINPPGGVLTINGNISMPGNFYIGDTASAPAQNSFAIGGQAQATGERSMALGMGTQATQTYSTALGPLAMSTGSNAIAFGVQASASANYSIAIGDSAQATAQGAVAIGKGVVNDVINSTKFGGAIYANGNVNLTTFNVSAVNCIVFDTGGKICSGA